MKLSISLSPVEVEFLDGYARQHRIGSRSAAVQQAIRVLRAAELGEAYETAWAESAEDGTSSDWDVVVADGLPRT